MEIHIDNWKKLESLDDCPPLYKKVLAIHNHKIYVGSFQEDGSEGVCWQLEDETGIQWVDGYDIDAWIEKEALSQDEIIMAIKKFKQIQIYSVHKEWVVQLFDNDVAPNDIGFSCIWECSGEDLYDLLNGAFEWIVEQDSCYSVD